VAVDGSGVFETLKAVTKLTLRSLRRRMAAQEAVASPGAAPVPPGPAARSHVTFNPAALTAAAAEGLGNPASATDEALRAVAAAEPGAAAASVAQLSSPPPGPAPATLTAEPAPQAPSSEETTAELPIAEEVEEGPVEFATTPEPVAEAVETEMRHVKVSSSLDILAELEALRKSSTFRPEPRPARPGAPALDIESLLQGSVNSRQEVRRRVDETVGVALGRASRCLVNIQLVDQDGRPIGEVTPVEVELKHGSRLRHLALTLVVNLQGE